MAKQEISYGPRKPLSLDIETFTILENISNETKRTKASVLHELLVNKAAELGLPEVVVIDRPSLGRPRTI